MVLSFRMSRESVSHRDRRLPILNASPPAPRVRLPALLRTAARFPAEHHRAGITRLNHLPTTTIRHRTTAAIARNPLPTSCFPKARSPKATPQMWSRTTTGFCAVSTISTTILADKISGTSVNHRTSLSMASPSSHPTNLQAVYRRGYSTINMKSILHCPTRKRCSRAKSH